MILFTAATTSEQEKVPVSILLLSHTTRTRPIISSSVKQVNLTAVSNRTRIYSERVKNQTRIHLATAIHCNTYIHSTHKSQSKVTILLLLLLLVFFFASSNCRLLALLSNSKTFRLPPVPVSQQM